MHPRKKQVFYRDFAAETKECGRGRIPIAARSNQFQIVVPAAAHFAGLQAFCTTSKRDRAYRSIDPTTDWLRTLAPTECKVRAPLETAYLHHPETRGLKSPQGATPLPQRGSVMAEYRDLPISCSVSVG